MKRIFIASHGMEIGGAERSLLGLLNVIDYSQFQVDLCLYRHTGELLSLIPEEVKLLSEDRRLSALAEPVKETLLRGQLLMVFGRWMGKTLSKRFDKKNFIKGDSQVSLEYSHKYTKCFIHNINPKIEYDLAISFLTPHYITAEKVRAKTKIAWIHTDYSSINIDINSEYKMWNKYDYICAISDACSLGFLSKFPQLKTKIIKFENILSEKFIKEQSKLIDTSKEMISNGNISLCSVGRFTSAKNFDNIPYICKHIREMGSNIKWYLIGYGGEEELIRNNIQKAGMEDYVIILGKKINPYPYIKNCDIYVQPSRFEGKAVTVREAQMLNKPVIITDYPTSKSQLMEGIDGIIVPLDNNECAKGIFNLISNLELRSFLIENTKKTNYENRNEINKLYKLMG